MANNGKKRANYEDHMREASKRVRLYQPELAKVQLLSMPLSTMEICQHATGDHIDPEDPRIAIEDRDWPQLPEMRDHSTIERVFTHSSSDQKTNYEYLEFFGDAVIELVSTKILREMYINDLTAGQMTQLREQMVNNERLSTFALAYKLDEHLYNSFDVDRLSEKTYIKILGDVFEAYIGGLWDEDQRDGTPDRAEAFLRELFAPLMPSFPVPVDQEAVKSKLYMVFGPSGSGAKVHFEDLGQIGSANKAQQRFRARAWLNGWGHERLVLGEGVGQNKKEARAAAAKAALQRADTDPELHRIAEKVEAHLEQKRAKRAAEAEAAVKNEAEAPVKNEAEAPVKNEAEAAVKAKAKAAGKAKAKATGKAEAKTDVKKE